MSTNGTQINGETIDEIKRHPIEDGDRINFAGVTEGTINIERE